MTIAAHALDVGDVIRLHDWILHVVAAEHDVGTAVLTAEFDFLLHFDRDEPIEVLSSPHTVSKAA